MSKRPDVVGLSLGEKLISDLTVLATRDRRKLSAFCRVHLEKLVERMNKKASKP